MIMFGDSFVDVNKTSIECNPAKSLVFVSKTGPMCTLSHKAHTNFESGLLRGSVYSLQTSVYFASLLIDCQVTKYWPFPTSAEKPATCDT